MATSLKARIGPQGFIPMEFLAYALISLLIVVLVLFLINALPVDRRTKQIVRVIVIIIGVLYLLRFLSI
jgi:hypothetical protein